MSNIGELPAAAKLRAENRASGAVEHPVIYDVGIDEFRLVTQADIDTMTGNLERHGLSRAKLREAFAELGVK